MQMNSDPATMAEVILGSESNLRVEVIADYKGCTFD